MGEARRAQRSSGGPNAASQSEWPEAAVIFDVDGVLLELTRAEEDAFFAPFETRHGITGLSRDWDSYRTRNDEDIIAEILEAHGLAVPESTTIIADYLDVLRGGIGTGALKPVEIPGARELLAELVNGPRLGVATANFIAAAQLRLEATGFWPAVSQLAFGAEGGGHKRDTVARAIAATGLPPDRIVYIGDNLNDVEAGLGNGVHFIGFSVDEPRRHQLHEAGARHTSGDHETTLPLIRELLRL